MKTQNIDLSAWGIALIFLFGLTINAWGFDSCANVRPPFLSESIKPNVLFILDNSGSMNELAYHEVEGQRCNSGTVWTGYNPAKKYYGLFDPDKTYKYNNSNHYFYPVGTTVDDPSTTTIHERAACLASNCTTRTFSGNWLNWWTMRRFDVAKKVLTGGRMANDANEYVLIGSPLMGDRRRVFNDYSSSDTPTDGNIVPSNKNVYYTPFHRAIYSYFFNNDPTPRQGQFVPLFSVVTARFDETSDFNGTTCVDAYVGGSPDGDSYLPDDSEYANLGESGKNYPAYYVAVKVGTVGVDSLPRGVVQNVASKVRLGYMHFNLGVGPGEGYTQGYIYDRWDIDGDGTDDVVWRYGDGGQIVNYVGDDSVITSPQGDSILSIVHNINEQMYEMFTPLSEVLNEAMRYFKQESPCYAPGEGGTDFSITQEWDPFYFNSFSTYVPCVNSYIVLVTDGESNSNDGVNNCGSVNENFPGDGGGYLDDIAFRIHTTDLRTDNGLSGDQTIELFTVFTFEDSQKARNELMRAARAGGFNDLDGDGTPYCDQNCSYNWDINFYPGSCNTTSCSSGCREWDTDCNGVPDNYFEAQDGYLLEQQLSAVFNEILTSSSGTSVSILTARSKKGSLTNQAIFYPKKMLNSNVELDWPGYLYTYWFLNTKTAQNIREDTNNNYFLDLFEDYILNFQVNEAGSLIINRYNSAANGTQTTLVDSYDSLDDIQVLWEAGEKLANTVPGVRNIHFSDSSDTVDYLSELNATNLSANASGIQRKLGTDYTEYPSCLGSNITTAQINLVRFIRGEDIPGCRDRAIDTSHIWKLGDIIYSSPKIVEYGDYSLVFVGANDGMLHAFREGKVRTDGLGVNQIVRICDDANTTCSYASLGKEEWAFIPSNIMPYLRYLASPDYYNCHLYFVDLTPYIINEDIDDDGYIDKRILIGGMRLGGACGCNGADCITPPLDTCPDPTSSNCTGLSSYFALDVTTPDSPKFLWEFSHPDLGFSYSGPAYIKTKSHRYIMFLSGPTDYNGEAGQDLKIFVLQVDDSFKLVRTYTIDSSVSSTLSSFNNSFGGRLFTDGIDYDDNGTTDAVFFGVNKKSGSTWQGNLLLVKPNNGDPTTWDVEKVFNSAIEPITAKVEYMKCFNMNFIYFGTGRWFFKTDEEGQNSNDVEKLYGVRIDDCLRNDNCNLNAAHNTSDMCTELATNNLAAWKVDVLEPKGGGYFKERTITDPTTSPYNIVFFTTTQPSADLCKFGGRSRMWAMNCATGGNITSSCPNDQYLPKNYGGTLLLQLSRGNISDIGVGENSFNQEGGLATGWMTGIPPESSTPLAGVPPGTEGEIILWMEK